MTDVLEFQVSEKRFPLIGGWVMRSEKIIFGFPSILHIKDLILFSIRTTSFLLQLLTVRFEDLINNKVEPIILYKRRKIKVSKIR